MVGVKSSEKFITRLPAASSGKGLVIKYFSNDRPSFFHHLVSSMFVLVNTHTVTECGTGS